MDSADILDRVTLDTLQTLPYKDCIPWSLRSEISAESRKIPTDNGQRQEKKESLLFLFKFASLSVVRWIFPVLCRNFGPEHPVHTLPYKACIPWSLRSEISAESGHSRTMGLGHHMPYPMRVSQHAQPNETGNPIMTAVSRLSLRLLSALSLWLV